MDDTLAPPPRLRLALDALAPFEHRTSFESLVARALGDLAGADPALGVAATSVGTLEPGDLDRALGDAFGDGVQALGDADILALTPGVTGEIGAGDAAELIREGMVEYLPPADTPIVLDPGPRWPEVPVEPIPIPPPDVPIPGPSPGDAGPPPTGYTRDQATRIVTGWYFDVLRRAPDAAGLDTWVGFFLDGYDYDWIYARFLEAARVELASRGG